MNNITNSSIKSHVLQMNETCNMRATSNLVRDFNSYHRIKIFQLYKFFTSVRYEYSCILHARQHVTAFWEGQNKVA